MLAITSELPWPLDSGGRLRTFHVLSALANSCDLRLIMPVLEHQQEHVQTLASKGIAIVPVAVAARTKLGEARRLLQSRFRGEPYAMFGRHARGEVFAAVELELKRNKPEVVWLDHIDSLLFEPLARAAGAKTIIDLHNIYSLILDRMSDQTGNPFKRIIFRGEAKRLAIMERRAAAQCNLLLAVSDSEAEYYRKLGAKNVVVAPNGVDCGAFADLPTGRMDAKPVTLFLGTLNWGPNVAAAIHLAKKIFPMVNAQIPEAELWLVGRDPSPEVNALSGNGVTVAGSVPEIKPYLKDAALLAVPLEAGGGTRLKILEAFAAGLPVVSTAVGAEGIAANDGEHLRIVEMEKMAGAIVRLLVDASSGALLAENARQLVNEQYDWSRIGKICVGAVQAAAATS